jgi:plasmid maintenance system antidote protein VapI
MGIVSLIGMDEVRKELKLDEEQMKSLQAMRESMGGRGPGGPGGPEGRGRGPEGGRPEGGRPEGGRPEGGRPEGGRPEGGRPEGGRPEGGRPGGFGGGPGGPGGPPSAEQMKEMMDRMKKMRAEIEGKVSEILDPDQNSRILGLLIQRDGGRALTSSVLATALELTPEQLAKLDEVQIANMQETAKTMQQAMGGGPDGWTKIREQMDSIGKKSEESMLAVLTSEQRTQFDSMKGEKFEFPERGPGPGFGGPGGPGGPGFGGRGERGGDRPGGRGERPEIQ